MRDFTKRFTAKNGMKTGKAFSKKLSFETALQFETGGTKQQRGVGVMC